MTPLRLGVLGCGRMGRLHAERLQKTPGVDLVAVLDPAGVPAHLPGVKALPALDGLVVATPAHTHAELTLPLLTVGLPCLVEKPLSPDLDQARALAAFEHLSVNHIERFNPAVRALPTGLRPRYVHAERLGPFTGRSARIDVCMDLMVHDLDLLGALQPEATPSLMRAVGIPVHTSGVDAVQAWVELETPSGPCTASLSASRASRAPQRRLRLVDDAHYYSLDLRTPRVERLPIGAPPQAAESLPIPDGDALGAIHAAFLRALRGQGAFPVSGTQALRALEWAARLSELASA